MIVEYLPDLVLTMSPYKRNHEIYSEAIFGAIV
jgi:hypothetical protein